MQEIQNRQTDRQRKQRQTERQTEKKGGGREREGESIKLP